MDCLPKELEDIIINYKEQLEYKDIIDKYNGNWKIIAKQPIIFDNGMLQMYSKYLKIDWFDISENMVLSEEFIRKYSNSVCWSDICRYQKLSIKLINDYEDRIDWIEVSKNKNKLSEKFLITFRYYLKWDKVIYRQELSNDFIRQHSYNLPEYKIQTYIIRNDPNYVAPNMNEYFW